MNLITRQSRADEAAERWRGQYGPHNEKYRRLAALGPHPCPDECDSIIGNGSWTSLATCDECGAENVLTVQLGEPPDYESSTAWICRSCIEAALKLFEEKS